MVRAGREGDKLDVADPELELVVGLPVGAVVVAAVGRVLGVGQGEGGGAEEGENDEGLHSCGEF